MNDHEILLVAKDTLREFKHTVNKPRMFLLPRKRFSEYLNDMYLAPHPRYTPAFFAKLPHGNCIFYCPEIINALTKNFQREDRILFIEAITLHELYHIKNNFHIKTIQEALDSEKLVHKQLHEDYPEVSHILESLEKQHSKRLIKKKINHTTHGRYQRYYRSQGRRIF